MSCVFASGGGLEGRRGAARLLLDVVGLEGGKYDATAVVEPSTEEASTFTQRACRYLKVGSTIISVYFVVRSGRAKSSVGVIRICHVVNVSAGGIPVRSSMRFSSLYEKSVPHTLKEPAGEVQYACDGCACGEELRGQKGKEGKGREGKGREMTGSEGKGEGLGGEGRGAWIVPALIETFHGAPALSTTPTLRASVYTDVPLGRATLPRIGWAAITLPVPGLTSVQLVSDSVIGDASAGHACVWPCATAAPAAKTSMATLPFAFIEKRAGPIGKTGEPPGKTSERSVAS